MKTLPTELETYKRTPELDEHTTPAALRAHHATKRGVWARIRVHEGALRLRFEADGSEERLTPERDGVLAPEELHAVEPLGRVRFHVEFLRLPGMR